MMRATIRMIVGLVAVVALTGGWAWAGIEGSKHDFSSEEWSGGELCAACHTPHRAEPPAAAPLWNPNADLNRTFGTSPGKRGLEDKPAPGAGTLSCLRCHDGTVASSTGTGVVSGGSINKQHPGAFTPAHEKSDHPVGVKYPAFGKGYHAQTSVVAKGVPLPDGRVECVSCHDPHNEAGVKHMLVISNVRSALCLTCHKK